MNIELKIKSWLKTEHTFNSQRICWQYAEFKWEMSKYSVLILYSVDSRPMIADTLMEH